MASMPDCHPPGRFATNISPVTKPDLTRARAYGFWDKNYREATTLSQILPVKKSSYLAMPVFTVIVGYDHRALHLYKSIDSKDYGGNGSRINFAPIKINRIDTQFQSRGDQAALPFSLLYRSERYRGGDRDWVELRAALR